MDKTGFVTHNGLYRYTRMPSGLKNAPATSQRAMDIILAPVKWQHTLLCMGTVVIFSKIFEHHLNHVESALHLIGMAGITLKLKTLFSLLTRSTTMGMLLR